MCVHGDFTVISRCRAGLRDSGIIVNGGAVLGCESTCPSNHGFHGSDVATKEKPQNCSSH